MNNCYGKGITNTLIITNTVIIYLELTKMYHYLASTNDMKLFIIQT